MQLHVGLYPCSLGKVFAAQGHLQHWMLRPFFSLPHFLPCCPGCPHTVFVSRILAFRFFPAAGIRFV